MKRITVHDAFSNIPPDEWNALAGHKYPFLRAEFLHAAEKTDCVTSQTGWTPRHLTLRDRHGLRAAMPLYEKSHSWGEFVFDWAWANAYRQAGLNYYPKLVSSIPFTPAPSPRLLLRDAGDAEAAESLIKAAVGLTADTGCSSLHFLFPSSVEMPTLKQAGFLLRKDCQFHWHNRGYRCFDDFLGSFTAAKRKKARRDRRRVTESGIRFRRMHGAEVDDNTLSAVYRLISNTFMQRGSLPYYNQAFLREICDQIPEGILFILAEIESSTIACAVFFESEQTLWGRYWGSDGHYDSLHFETCYYQGIEYCIETGKQVFEPGTRGEHKISRGFLPVTTGSAHWLAQPQFSHAIEQYLHEEGRHIDHYMDTVDAHSPYTVVADEQ